MDFKHITALVPENEHFDSSVINEGVWLTSGHVAAIESALGTQIEAVNAGADWAAKINDLTLEGVAKDGVIADHLTTISTLEAKVAELGGKSSGNGTVIVTKEDEPAGGVKDVASYLDDSHPINAYADKRLKKTEQ